jgi:hypothetical protein
MATILLIIPRALTAFTPPTGASASHAEVSVEAAQMEERLWIIQNRG